MLCYGDDKRGCMGRTVWSGDKCMYAYVCVVIVVVILMVLISVERRGMIWCAMFCRGTEEQYTKGCESDKNREEVDMGSSSMEEDHRESNAKGPISHPFPEPS